MGDGDLPGDLQSLSWLTAVDVPRLQQMASERIELGSPGVPHTHPGRFKGGGDPSRATGKSFCLSGLHPGLSDMLNPREDDTLGFLKHLTLLANSR